MAIEKTRNWKEWRISKEKKLEEEEELRRRIEKDLDEKERVAEENRERDIEILVMDMGWTNGPCNKCWKEPCECLVIKVEERLKWLAGRSEADQKTLEDTAEEKIKGKRLVSIRSPKKLIQEANIKKENLDAGQETPYKKMKLMLERKDHGKNLKRIRPHHQPVALLAGDGDDGGPHHHPKEPGSDEGAPPPVGNEGCGPHHHPVKFLDDGGEHPILKIDRKEDCGNKVENNKTVLIQSLHPTNN